MRARKRKLSDADRLALDISLAIASSKCAPLDVVNALMAVAAGRAVISNTHTDCAAFEDEAHAAFHSALKAAILRDKGSALAN